VSTQRPYIRPGGQPTGSTDWIDRAEYPFASHYLALDAGRMHYLDEGAGPPIVMVHGTPDWSFGYRKLVKDLSPDYRCVVPDNLGFGLSDKPPDASYVPECQAERLSRLIERLDLRDVSLVLHDFGGPIGLAYALERPENVRRLVLMNTWMWSLRGDPHFELFRRLMWGPIGRFLYLRLNFSARVIMKQAFGDKSKLPPRVHQQYLRALPTPEDRVATWAYAQAVLGASDWYDSLWQQRARIREIPTLIAWGMRDVAFRKQELERLETVFAHARTVRFEDAGHFVQEEKPEALCALIREHLAGGGDRMKSASGSS
jgi:haloalkane dehalogenase